jgi:Raf kinase inhibitor-like YbhB/YbcL family protein
MKLSSPAFAHGAPIPPEYAFARPDAHGPMALSDNRSPPLVWSDPPEGTRSFVLLCHDPDVPSSGEDVNKPDRRVPADLPRVVFYHWVLFDLPADARALADGEASAGITPRGKAGPDDGQGRRHGLNDYTGWFAGDPEMEGSYFGYDGPCPPYNDTLRHHYWFTLYALDVARCPVDGAVDGHAVLAAIQPHVLASAAVMGTYTIHPDVA